jgi:peptidoglycan/LPS O-acetylase OafA/YrhL
MPELDTIRGLAILMVVLYHGLFWKINLAQFHGIEKFFLASMSFGRFGVNLFFVLSGFLITGILMNSRQRHNYFRHFYIRRILRIVPAYLVILAVLAAIRYASPAVLFMNLLYLSNLNPLFGIPLGYPVLWSLAVEEHFYAFWPAVVRHLRVKSLMICCVAVIFLSPLCRLANYLFLAAQHVRVRYVFNDYTWNSLDGLACGALLSLILHEYKIQRKSLRLFSLLLTGLAILILLAGLPFGIFTRLTPVGVTLQVVPIHLAFTALLSLFLLLGTGPHRAIVHSSILRFLGEISYGLYLIHLLVFELCDRAIAHFWKDAAVTSTFHLLFLRLLAEGGLSIGIAFLSRKYFEERFLRLKDRLSG